MGQYTPRDIGLWVINDIGAERGDYNVLEFYGPAVHDMTVDWRMVLCNLSSDIGAKSAICDVDQVTLDYVTPRARRPFEVVRSDPDANYAYTFEYDVSKMVPAISVPPSPDYVEPLTQHLGKHVDQAYIGSCVGGTIEDLRLAAKVLKGHKIHPRVRLVVSPNTMPNYQQASAEGLLQILAESGAHIMEPSCFPCYGMMFQLADGEVCISSSVRNDPGRMGNINSTIYLANAATTAASAVKGEIADPREFLA